MPVDRSQLRRIIDKMEAWMNQVEEQRAREDAENEKEQLIDPLAAPCQPFSDGDRPEKSAPQAIHGEGRKDLFH
jgi:hypothetical protein